MPDKIEWYTCLLKMRSSKPLAEYLGREGYRIDKQLTTLEQGIDIDAVHIATSRRLLVEANGGTSSKEGTARQNQAESHVAVAFYCGAKLLEKYALESAEVALAFPDHKNHRGFIEDISGALRRLEIMVYFVDQNRQIHTFSSRDDRTRIPD
jgi:hypothetical protein